MGDKEKNIVFHQVIGSGVFEVVLEMRVGYLRVQSLINNLSRRDNVKNQLVSKYRRPVSRIYSLFIKNFILIAIAMCSLNYHQSYTIMNRIFTLKIPLLHITL